MIAKLAALGLVAVVVLLGAGAVVAENLLTVVYLSRDGDPAYVEQRAYTGLKLRERKPPVSGARSAIKEAKILGRAAGLGFVLDEEVLPESADAIDAIAKLKQDHAPAVFVLDLPLDDVTRAGHAFAGDPGAVLFNIRFSEDSLRADDCSPALFHTIPSDAMLSDAIAQHMVSYNWSHILVLSSTNADDNLKAQAFVRSAHKFGLTIAAERNFTDSNDPREREKNDNRLLTGGVNYDAIYLADSVGEFGRYLQYATYLPRPVVGAEGLVADAWHWTWERNGAPQLNQRIRKISGRDPDSGDWAAWVAVRSVVQAATDIASIDPAQIRARLRADDFTVDMYKIGAGSYRQWDNQLRQPILLHTQNAVVGVAPIDGFLHRVNVLDTLGVDQPESTCAALNGK